MPRIKLPRDGFKARRGQRIDGDLGEELAGGRGRRDGDSEQALNVLEVDLGHVGSGRARPSAHPGTRGVLRGCTRQTSLLGAGGARPSRPARLGRRISARHCGTKDRGIKD